MPNILAVIPARGGSKGLPRKNLRLLLGHPLLAYSVAAARQSRLVTRTLCTTDDEEIAAAARRYGAETPFLRPAELAQDDTLDLPVYQHALAWLEKNENWRADLVVQLRPTSPLRPAGYVDEAVTLLLQNEPATAVRSVCPAPANPYKMWRLDQAAPFMRNLLDVPGVPEPFNSPRQALPQAWWQTGTIDVVRADVIRGGSMTGPHILPIKISHFWAQDIDDAPAFDRAAETMLVLPCVTPGVQPDLGRVRLLVLDVDGTLTPGTMYYNKAGEESKRFHTHDGQGMANVRRAGVEVAVITREDSPAVTARMAKLGITHYHRGVLEKLPVLQKLAESLGVTLAEVAYVGDDESDLTCLRAVREAGGLACAVEDARPEARREAVIVTPHGGGGGAVRDICDRLCEARRLAAEKDK